MRSAEFSSLNGRRVLITGAARGLGAGLACQLASHGARLALVGLERETLEAVAERCPGRHFVREVDVRRRELLTGAIDAAADELGGLDVVVANAGIAAGGAARSIDPEVWERVIDVDLIGVWNTNRAALPHLERSGGYLLNLSSIAAALRTFGLTPYAAAKAGVEAHSDCLRMEMQSRGVDVGVAYFTFLHTDMVQEVDRELPFFERVKQVAPGPLGKIYPSAPAVDALVEGIVRRKRRIAYPRWVLGLLPFRQLLASRLAERVVARQSERFISEHDELVRERGAAAASASARTLELTGPNAVDRRNYQGGS